MKLILISSCLVLSNLLAAQTTIIAHKSHSGAAATFAFADPGNFGLPSSRLLKVTKVSDTSVVMTNSRGGRETNDTIYHHPVFSDPNITVDSMKQIYYYENVTFERFEETPESLKTDTVSNERKLLKTQQTLKKQPAPQKKSTEKEQNTLFWLWIIGGGTFTGLLLLSRKRKPLYA